MFGVAAAKYKIVFGSCGGNQRVISSDSVGARVFFHIDGRSVANVFGER